MSRRLLTLLLTAVLLLGGCGLFGGDDAEAPPGAGPEAEDDTLAPTGWDIAAADEVRPSGTLRLAVRALPGSFNPAHADAASTFGPSEVERLLGPTSGSAVRLTERGAWEVDEDYARSVEVVETDPLTVRVELNPEAVWQDGTAITSADMEAYWQARRGEDDDYQAAPSQGHADIESVEADGDTAYEVVFESPRSDWPLYVYPRLPAEVSEDAEAFNEAFTERPVPSNGPFVITGIDAETGTITQERNPRWWGREPRLESVVWRVADLPVQAEAYEAEELDVIELDAETVEGVDEDRIRRSSGARWSHLTLNAGRGPLQDADVRRAVAIALDRDAIADQAVAGLGAPAGPTGSLLTVPGQAGYRDAAEQVLGRDVEAARALLADAGYDVSEETTRDGEQLTLTLPVPEGSPTVTGRARLIGENLAELGIALRTPSVPLEEFTQSVLVPRDFDLVTFSWDASLLGVQSARTRFRPVDAPDNVTGVESGSAQEWAAAGAELDDEERGELVRDLDTTLLEQHVMVPLAVAPSVMAVRQDVVNVGPSAFEQPDWTIVGLRGSQD